VGLASSLFESFGEGSGQEDGEPEELTRTREEGSEAHPDNLQGKPACRQSLCSHRGVKTVEWWGLWTWKEWMRWVFVDFLGRDFWINKKTCLF